MNLLNAEAKLRVFSLVSICLSTSLIFFKAGRFLSLPCYPGQLLEMEKNIPTSQERNRRYKGWKQAVLYLPFPNAMHKGWWQFQMRAYTEVGVSRVKGPFIASLFEWLQAFCNIVLNTDGGKKFKYLFDLQHVLCHLIEEPNIKKLSSRCARGHTAPEVNRSHC